MLPTTTVNVFTYDIVYLSVKDGDNEDKLTVF